MHRSNSGDRHEQIPLHYRRIDYRGTGLGLSSPTGRGPVCLRVFRSENIKSVSFLISDKQEGPFRLEIDWVKAYR